MVDALTVNIPFVLIEAEIDWEAVFDATRFAFYFSWIPFGHCGNDSDCFGIKLIENT